MLPLLAALLAVGLARGAPRPRHATYPAPRAGVEVTSWLPRYGGKQFPAGAEVEVVIGVSNNGVGPVNVSGIFGSLNNHLRFHEFYQNFSFQAESRTVPEGQQVSLSYTIHPFAQLPPREFQVAVVALYQGKLGELYSSTAFNETIDIAEVKKLVDTELLFLYFILAGLAVAAAYAAHRYWLLELPYWKKQRSAARPWVAGKPGTAGKPEAASVPGQDDWLRGTNWTAGGPKPRRKGSKPLPPEK